jgi:hypothetical protein
LRRLLIPLLLLAVLAAGVPAALADGDPASDYLLRQSTFLSPFDGQITKDQENEIVQLLASAQKQGFPLKVAMIRTAYDLGAVPILFRKPQTYARFLGEEDFYYWKDELLVVMPNGYGIYKAQKLPAADKAAIAKLPKLDTSNGQALGAATIAAIHKLAEAHGIELTASTSASSGSSSMWAEDAEIVSGALALLALGFGIRYAVRRSRRAR